MTLKTQFLEQIKASVTYSATFNYLSSNLPFGTQVLKCWYVIIKIYWKSIKYDYFKLVIERLDHTKISLKIFLYLSQAECYLYGSVVQWGQVPRAP